jgi:hypothetical protein
VFVANAHYVFANLRTWGWITTILGVLQLLAAVGGDRRVVTRAVGAVAGLFGVASGRTDLVRSAA